MNLRCIEKRIKINKPKMGLLGRLLANTALSFFIALIVFVIATFILVPKMISQDMEIESLRQEIRALNETMQANQQGGNLMDNNNTTELTNQNNDVNTDAPVLEK